MKPKQNIPIRLHGFTLVELLVVIVIVAALSTLGFLGMRRAMDGATKAKTMGNLKQLASTTQMFSSENNGAVMDWSGTVVNGQKRNWSHHLLVTLDNNLAANESFKTSAGDAFGLNIGIFSDPKALKKASGKLDKSGHNSWRTYAYNNRIGTYTPESPEPIPYKQGAKYTYQVEAPEKLILFSQRILDGTKYFAFLQPEDGESGKLAFDLYNGSIMVGFFDGHVEMMTKKNYPSKEGVNISQSTGKPYTKTEWNEYWWGRKTKIDPL